MSIFKNPYTIIMSGIDLGKTVTIGSSETEIASGYVADYQHYAFDPVISQNVNGVKKFSFKMHSKFFDNSTGMWTSNKFIPYLINEREISLSITKDGTPKSYDFILKNITEDSKTHTNTYQFEDALVQELAKNGFNVTLDEKLGNNTGNLEELASYVLADTDWEVEVEGTIMEEVQDFVVNATKNDGTAVKVPYSSCVNKPFLFQTVTLGERDSEGFFNTTSTVEFKNPTTYKSLNGLYVPSNYASVVINQNERIKRTNYVHLSKYIPYWDKYVYKYSTTANNSTTHYGYVESKFQSPVFIQNLITNYAFDGTSGWTGAKMVPKTSAVEGAESTVASPKATVESVYGRFDRSSGEIRFVSAAEDLMNGNFSENIDYTSYLKVVFSGSDGVVVNSGPRDNRSIMENLVPSSQWAFKLVYLTENGEETTNGDEINVNIGEYSYDGNSNADGYKLDNNGLEFTKVQQTIGDYMVYSAPSSQKYTDEDFKKKSNIRILLQGTGTYYIKEIQFFKVVKNNSNKMILPDKVGTSRADSQISSNSYANNDDTNATIEKTYKYFKAIDIDEAIKGIKSWDEIKPVRVTSTLSYSQYKPVHNNGEKIRSVNIKESNYFNILQTLAETFGVWLVLEKRNNTKTAVFKQYVGETKDVGFEYGKNLQNIQRTYESKNIVSKLIVKQNSNQYGENGFCTIARAKSNPTGDSCIYDFRYFQDKGLMNTASFLNEYSTVGNIKGYFPTMRDLNGELRETNEKFVTCASELTQYKAKYELADAGVKAAESSIEEAKNSFEMMTGFSMDMAPFMITSVTLTLENITYENYNLNTALEFTVPEQAEGSNNFSSQITIKINYEEGTDVSKQPQHIFYIHASPQLSFTNGNIKTKEYIVTCVVESGKTSGTATLEISSMDIGGNTCQRYIEEYSEYLRQKRRFQAELNDLKRIENGKPAGKLVEAETLYNTLKKKISDLEQDKTNANITFFTNYSKYIHEGTWVNEQCVDDEKYYSDALSVMYNSSYPKVAYSIDVVDISPLDNSADYGSDYSNYVFNVGDTTYIIDEDFFGDDENHSIIVTELVENLNDPSKNIIKVQNFKDQFQDLFQKITATVQETKFSTGSYKKAVALAEANQAKKQAFMADAMDSATARLSTAGQQSVVWGNDGITIKSIDTPGDAIRMVGGAILLSKQDKNGEQKWVTGVTSDGVSASLVTAGVLNAGEISIMNYDEPMFRWDTFGLSAFDADWYNSEIGTTVSSVNTRKFVRFDKHGLYGINNSGVDGLSWRPGGLGTGLTPQQEIDQKATFSLTWEGFKVTNTNGVTLRIGDNAKTGQGNANLLDVRGSNGESIISITENGSFVWGDSVSPMRALYKRTISEQDDKPNGNGIWSSDYFESDEKDENGNYTNCVWHKVKTVDDFYVSYSYDDCKTWGEPIQIQGRNGTAGKDGINGVDAINCYIESSMGTFFQKGTEGKTTLTARIFKGDQEIDPNGTELSYTWYLGDAPISEASGKSWEANLSTLLGGVVTFEATK